MGFYAIFLQKGLRLLSLQHEFRVEKNRKGGEILHLSDLGVFKGVCLFFTNTDFSNFLPLHHVTMLNAVDMLH